MPYTPRLPRLAAILVLLGAIGPAPVLAAGATPSPGGEPPRPRIGLALGGGSARGLAHVGVLEWLRDHRVPIDAVAGTSAGGLIGGFYATGMTEQDIRAMTQGIDWDALLASDAPFDDNTFRRKQDRRAYPAGLELGVRRVLWLPRSLNPGQRVALLLDRLTLAYPALASFDDLPTPFRCVAFDINRSERVVLDKGVLSEAMRATMALPGLFPPVTIGGRLLVDGGFVDNVPADVVRQMSVDVVIAVDVSISPASDPDVTALSMVSRAIDAVMAIGTKRSLKSADIVITPDLALLTSLDWNSAEKWRDRGYKAAAAKASELLKYSVSQAEYDAHEAARQARRRTAPIVPSTITVTGVGPSQQAKIVSQLSVEAGKPLDLDRLAQDLLQLSGTDRYELLTYHLAADPAGTRLEITVRPKANGPAFLTLGVELNNNDAANFAMNVLGRTTVYDAVGDGSEVRIDFALGTRQSVGGELYRPVGLPWLFAAPHVFVGHSTRNRFDGERLVGEYGFTQAGGGLDLGMTVGRKAELRVGAEALHVAEELLVGDPSLPVALGWERVATARFTFDGQDSPVVPSHGLYARAWARRFFSAPGAASGAGEIASFESPRRFWQAEFDATAFHTITRGNRLFARGAGGTSFEARPYFNDFSLGGPFRMSAFRIDQLRGPHFALAGAGYIRQLPSVPGWLGGHAYLATWVEVGSAFQSRATAAWYTDLSAGVIVDSIIGPLFVGGSAGPGGHRRIYISLGPLFR
ncbi:MAG TPA: patatin-like phospholipase family protein [Vicinamibacterales bacterium]